ncbi:hypothetical protein QNH48_15425 [Neobacillus sp. YX16]|uniref:hypothetical protein n=1 Tax=Neobacillus sp. YX16 TaxID=3047874 RepID=UPI0024C3B56D|nr:hypothetical protein [Neobacillus sp. YX16]WHZ00468.1 hypothetical protein QNH48_15425 [Neobacillus sp. YX16]
MKKLVTSAFTLILLLGLGTGVMAASDQIACKVGDFKEMLPMMQEKHPELSDKELKEMHKDCAAKMKKGTSADCMINN